MARPRRSTGNESATVARQLAPLRRGSRGALREATRQMLLQLIGIPRNEWPPPGRKPGRPLGPDLPRAEDAHDLALVAHDALRELGYDAAADELGDVVRDGHVERLPRKARAAYDLLEAGPPSMRLPGPSEAYVVFKEPMYRVRHPLYGGGTREYLVARSVHDTVQPWYRFAVGVPVHDRDGSIGWDHDGGFTFSSAFRTLKQARWTRP